MATIQDLDDSSAASLVLLSLCENLGREITRKGGFLGLSKRSAFDIIISKARGGGDEYGCYTFYAVKGGRAKSSTAVFGEVVVKEIVKQLFNHAITSLSPAYAMAGDLEGAFKSGSIDSKGIYAKAKKLGGQMQLHAAKKMGRDVYDQCRVFGLGADVRFGGAIRFEIKMDGGGAYLVIMIRAWYGLSGSARWVDRFKGDGGVTFRRIDTMGGDRVGNFTYRPGTGLQKL